jgi:hypothetical protein
MRQHVSFVVKGGVIYRRWKFVGLMKGHPPLPAATSSNSRLPGREGSASLKEEKASCRPARRSSRRKPAPGGPALYSASANGGWSAAALRVPWRLEHSALGVTLQPKSGATARKHSVTRVPRVADDAILICRGTRGQECPVERYFLAIGSYDRDRLMMHLVEKEKLQRANAAPDSFTAKSDRC